MTAALKTVLGLLFVQLLPLADQVQMRIMFARGLSNGFNPLHLANDLQIEVFREDTSFEAHSQWFRFLFPPHALLP